MLQLHISSRWSALLVSLIILVLVTILTTVFLERIWNSSKTVEWIEASNAAYYQATGIIEQQLMDPLVSKRSPWMIPTTTETFSMTGRSLVVYTGGSIMPIPWLGNSPYHPDYNIIALGQPVQIVIPNGIDWTNVSFYFRVPQIGLSSTWVQAGFSSGVILWTLWYTWASLYASGETNIFRWSDINSTGSLASFSGITNTGSFLTVNTFYTDSNFLWTSGVRCAGYNCTLKLSMIRPVPLDDGRILPFLEYRIDFGVASVPSQYMLLDATAYSYGFQRSRQIRIPQITTNTALDFAVLQ